MPTLVLVLIAMALMALGSLLTLALTFPRRGRVHAAQYNLGKAYWHAMALRYVFATAEDQENFCLLLREMLDSWRVLTGCNVEPPKPEIITSHTGFKLAILALFMLTLPGCLLTPSEMGIGLVIVVMLLGALWALLNRWYKKYDQD